MNLRPYPRMTTMARRYFIQTQAQQARRCNAIIPLRLRRRAPLVCRRGRNSPRVQTGQVLRPLVSDRRSVGWRSAGCLLAVPVVVGWGQDKTRHDNGRKREAMKAPKDVPCRVGGMYLVCCLLKQTTSQGLPRNSFRRTHFPLPVTRLRRLCTRSPVQQYAQFRARQRSLYLTPALRSLLSEA